MVSVFLKNRVDFLVKLAIDFWDMSYDYWSLRTAPPKTYPLVLEFPVFDPFPEGVLSLYVLLTSLTETVLLLIGGSLSLLREGLEFEKMLALLILLPLRFMRLRTVLDDDNLTN